MKRAIGIIFGLLFALTSAYAASDLKYYGNVGNSEGDALVGSFGYVDIDNAGNPQPDVFVCATTDGRIWLYGMNLQSDLQKARGTELVKQLSQMDFGKEFDARGWDWGGCLRANI